MTRPPQRRSGRLAAQPSYADFETGALLREAEQLRVAGEVAKAAALCRKALARHPGSPKALNVLGKLAAQTGNFDVAIGLHQRALAGAPRDAAILFDLGEALRAAGQSDAALIALKRALAADPQSAPIRNAIGNTLLELGRRDEAIANYRATLAQHPRDDFAKHMLQALSESRAADPAYVASLFDSYAEIFERHLSRSLNYRMPEAISALLQAVSPGRRFEHALDLGCGTGLVAKALGGMISVIDGVDLSAGMIAHATTTGLYRGLATGDLVTFLDQRAPQSADLVIAADVFNYVGRLDDTFAAVHRVLRSGSLFVFSIEHPAGGGDLNATATGRFAHSPAYIADLAANYGFTQRAAEAATIRTENGRSVEGALIALEP